MKTVLSSLGLPTLTLILSIAEVSALSPTLLPLLGVFMSDALGGTVVGDSGLILHTESGGVTSVDDNRASQMLRLVELMQNYPNPFNPTTTMQFALPVSAHVTLRMFNTLGQEVKLLIDVVLEAGHHTVEWDGTDNRGAPLASGLYLYRLDIEENGRPAARYSQTKKLLLLR